MTRTELNDLTIELAKSYSYSPVDSSDDFAFTPMDLQRFSNTLLVEIQKKLEVVRYIDPMYGLVVRSCRPELSVKLTTLPIIEE